MTKARRHSRSSNWPLHVGSSWTNDGQEWMFDPHLLRLWGVKPDVAPQFLLQLDPAGPSHTKTATWSALASEIGLDTCILYRAVDARRGVVRELQAVVYKDKSAKNTHRVRALHVDVTDLLASARSEECRSLRTMSRLPAPTVSEDLIASFGDYPIALLRRVLHMASACLDARVELNLNDSRTGSSYRCTVSGT